jgi:hypothetical protein
MKSYVTNIQVSTVSTWTDSNLCGTDTKLTLNILNILNGLAPLPFWVCPLSILGISI